MTPSKTIFLCLGLIAVMSLPLAGCTNTWHGMKNDWHGMTDGDSNADAAPQHQAAPAEPVVVTPNNGPSAYN